jgi:hypothetical protein
MATPFGYPFHLDRFPTVSERRCSLMARIKALLVVLGLLALAALNGATPWGP